MKKILIALENSVLNTSFGPWLSSRYGKNASDIIFAGNKLEAIEALKTNKIDVLVMELTATMLDILLFGIKKSLKTKLILLNNTTSYIKNTLFGFYFIKKTPFTNLKYLLKSLIEGINKGDYLSATIESINIETLFYLIIFVKKHGFIGIEAGYVYFNNGYLWMAKYKDLEGEQAIFHILDQSILTVSFLDDLYKKDFQRQIFKPFKHLLKKYHDQDIIGDQSEKIVVDKEDLTEKRLIKQEQIKQEQIKQEQIKQEQIKQEQIKQALIKLKKDKKSLAPYLQKLYETEGYLEIMVCDALGEIVINSCHKDYKKDFISLDLVSVTKDLKDIINNTSLEQCDFVQVDYEKASICSFYIYNPNLRVDILLKPDANIGMVKLIFNKLIL
jgi:hypothetical protein